MKTLSKILSHCILIVVAVQILNMSVYGGDFDQLYLASSHPTIGEYNEIDSFIEYFEEIILGHKDAFPENGAHNDGSAHNSIQIKHISVKLFNESIKVAEVPVYDNNVTHSTPRNEDYRFLFIKNIIPPPPKA